MNGERLFRILGLIDEDLIEEAGTASSTAAVQRRYHWLRWAAAAACLALAVNLVWRSGLMERMTASVLPGASGEDNSGIVHSTEPLSVEGTTFMSYAGPVFPLTTVETAPGLTAARAITWDFAAGTDQDGAPRQWGARVTDAYTLTNPTDSDLTVTALYPFVGAFYELETEMPVVTVNGEAVNAALYAGAYAGGFRDTGGGDGSTWNLSPPDSWLDYQALLESGDYLAQALGDAPALDTPVTVYEFSDFEAPREEYHAATQAISFDADREKTTVLTYGFNGFGWDEQTGWQQHSYFVPNGIRREPEVKMLLVLGEDIQNYTLQGYENGGCKAGEEIDGVSCTVTRRETTLDAALDELCQAYDQEYAGWQYGMEDSAVEAVPYPLFRRAVNELMVQYGPLSDSPKDRYADGRLDDLISEVMSQERVLYLAAPVTVPAGGSASVTLELWKEPCFDYGCSGSENVGLQGYDLVTTLGTTLDLTSQTARLVNWETIELVQQNLGFDVENGVTEVTLDTAQPHYYLEIREQDT